MNKQASGITRRQVLGWIGRTAGAAAMYQSMTALGFAAESTYRRGSALSPAPKGTSVLVLGAGLAGMTAAYEMRKAGYQVKVLEYNRKGGGRCWTIRGGDKFTETGGATQKCGFDKGQYLNPGPWRIPYHHHGVLDYCHEFGVPLEPFIQVNYNALVHSVSAFGGKPKRYREVNGDFQGHISELLGKAINQGGLDQTLTREDREKLLETLREWGGLGKNGAYKKSLESSLKRGFEVSAGGGLMPKAQPSEVLDREELLNSNLWKSLIGGQEYEFQSTIFQPVGGMDKIAQAFQDRVGDLITFGAKVTRIQQSESGVTVSYTNANAPSETIRESADYCVCTIPLSILSQIPIDVSPEKKAAIKSVPYDSLVKVGLQFKRRFWEQDESIYGGITHTDLPINRISYPSTEYGSSGKGVLLGAYIWGPNAYKFTTMTPAQRIDKTLEYGSQIHDQYRKEFDNGFSVAWHKVPWTNGCYGMWTSEKRDEHYENLCKVDGRIVLAGEHASYIPAWMEGAILSAKDAINRIHSKALTSNQTA